MKLDDWIDRVVEGLDFAVLVGWADIYSVKHNENSWFDDEWPDKEDELRVELAKTMKNSVELLRKRRTKWEVKSKKPTKHHPSPLPQI